MKSYYLSKKDLNNVSPSELERLMNSYGLTVKGIQKLLNVSDKVARSLFNKTKTKFGTMEYDSRQVYRECLFQIAKLDETSLKRRLELRR